MYPLRYLIGLDWFRDGAWFEPSTETQINDAAQLLELNRADTVAELGAGDGAAVVMFARKKCQVVGFEKDEKLVRRAEGKIQALGLEKNAHIKQASFWEEDLGSFNKVYIYQFKTVMKRLEEKLLAELPEGALVASNTWQFPHWKPSKKLGDIFLYRKTSRP